MGNFLGTIAVLMWGVLPLLRLLAGEIPPLQLTSMSLFMACAVTFVLNGHPGKSSRNQGETRARPSDTRWSSVFLPGTVVLYFAALAVAGGAWMSGTGNLGTRLST